MLNQPLDIIFPQLPDEMSEEGLTPQALDLDRLPAHVAIIMDGNGRWAKARGKKRLFGHKAGVDSVREVVRCASDLGIRYLTVYSFSTENWARPKEEVIGLMDLFAKSILAEMDELHANNVRVQILGDISVLPKKTRKAFEVATEMMKNNTGMTLLPAVNYGSRAEILRAVNAIVAERNDKAQRDKPSGNLSHQVETDPQRDKPSGNLSHQVETAPNTTQSESDTEADFPITEQEFEKYLYTHDVPSPELLIRTSGEMRISNFLLWQIAYSEFYVTDTLWPDFDRYEFLRALLAYQNRDRRFGGVESK